MVPECNTTLYLQKIAGADGPSDPQNLACVASSALRIISDAAEYRLTAMDVDCLEWLVVSLVEQGHTDLLSQVLGTDADCEICRALAERLQRLNCREALAS